MNDTPTSGPTSTSMTHQAREASSSRHSLRRSQKYSALREDKGDVLQIDRAVSVAASGCSRELVERAFAAHGAAAQQHEAIADASGVRHLMNRQKQCPPACRVRPQRRANVAALSKVETVEGLVDEQHGVWRQ